MKKKSLFLVCCLMTLMLLLTACGSGDKGPATYGGVAESDIESLLQSTATSLMDLSYEELIYYSEYYEQMAVEDESAKIQATIFSDWAEISDELGNFDSFGDFSIAKSGKTLTATQEINFTDRNARLIYVFNANTMQVTGINAELIYSLGETMKTAALNTVMGICIVFCILVLISLVISAFKIIPALEKKFSKDNTTQTTVVSGASLDEVSAEETDDLELVAVIAAAIAADTGTSTDSFVVRSIRRRY